MGSMEMPKYCTILPASKYLAPKNVFITNSGKKNNTAAPEPDKKSVIIIVLIIKWLLSCRNVLDSATMGNIARTIAAGRYMTALPMIDADA